jgi:hypothetical protein
MCRMPQGVAITEIPIAERLAESPERFRLTLQQGGHPKCNPVRRRRAVAQEKKRLQEWIKGERVREAASDRKRDERFE